MIEECKKLIQTYGPIIIDCFEYSNQHYFDIHKDELEIIEKRTKSNYIHDIAYSELKHSLSQFNDFIFDRASSLKWIGYKDIFVIKLKKMDRNFKVGFIPTKNAINFQEQKELDIAPKATRLYLGYVPDDIQNTIVKVAFSCPDKDGYQWNLELELTDTKQQIFTFPEIENENNQEKRIYIKKEILNKRKKNE